MNERIETSVLIVEPSPLNVRAIEQALAGHHVSLTVTVTVTAEGGLSDRAVADNGAPSLLILGHSPPDLDGLGELAILKAGSPSCELPVVVILGAVDPAARHEAYALGAVECIAGPAASIDPVELSRRLGHQVELCRVRAELEATQEAVRVAHRTKSEFLAGISHELRTPLNAINGFSEVLEEQQFGPLNERQRRYVGHILSSGRHLLALINDLLDLAKVESGKMELDLTEFDIKSVLERGRVMVKQIALKHNIRLELQVPDDVVRTSLSGDRRKLMQVVFNLLANAVKFTPDGGRIVVEARDESDWVVVSVSDTGIGVAEMDQERIFHEFEQVDSSLGRRRRGTGLGLALCRKILALHGGRIWVESAGDGQGSRFAFTVPRRQPARS